MTSKPLAIAVALGFATVGALLGLWAVSQRGGEHEPVRLLGGGAAPAQQPLAADVAAVVASAVPSANAARAGASFAGWMFEQSSLRGSALDGSWSELDAKGKLKPVLALRRRFDQLLTLQGEATLAQLAAYIEQEVGAAQGSQAAQQVMQVWSRYLELQRYRFNTRVDLQDRQTWAAALAERQPVRRNLLGADWAAAFYAAEDAELEAAIREPVPQPKAEATTNTAGIDVAALPPDARQRLADERAAWADWEKRLAMARQEWVRLQGAAELSAPQRSAAIERWLQQRFDTGEQRRVRALLQLPAPGS